MTTLAFDTLAFTKALEAAGMERNLAEALANATRDHAMRDIATKADIAALENRLTIKLGGMVAVATGIILAGYALLP